MPKSDGKTIAQRFNERFKIDPVTGCWNWTAGLNNKGYAYIWTGPNRRGDTRQAYKVAWELFVGPIPSGKELHHKCENNACVNPAHLEALTRKEHQQKHPSIQNNWRIARAAQRQQRQQQKAGVVYSL